MKLIVGLGNAGTQYAKTRHNAGFMVVDRLAQAHAPGETVKARFQAATVEATIAGERCLLLKPTTFMNRSGQSVSEALRFYKADAVNDLLIIVDELYLPTGRLKLQAAGGTAGHNGLASIEQLLGTSTYPRLRVGVGLQPSGGKPDFMDQADFVLGRFTEDEEPLLASAITKGMKATEAWISKGLVPAMNLANAPDTPPRPKPPRPQNQPPPQPPPQPEPPSS
jgi:peptidyl-tRNA hydrolase, PTH1 family